MNVKVELSCGKGTFWVYVAENDLQKNNKNFPQNLEKKFEKLSLLPWMKVNFYFLPSLR